MIANYGYSDGTGGYWVSIDTDKCDGCGVCVEKCPQSVYEIWVNDYDETVARVSNGAVRKLSYLCTVCKPNIPPPHPICIETCSQAAISHSW